LAQVFYAIAKTCETCAFWITGSRFIACHKSAGARAAALDLRQKGHLPAARGSKKIATKSAAFFRQRPKFNTMI